MRTHLKIVIPVKNMEALVLKRSGWRCGCWGIIIIYMMIVVIRTGRLWLATRRQSTIRTGGARFASGSAAITTGCCSGRIRPLILVQAVHGAELLVRSSQTQNVVALHAKAARVRLLELGDARLGAELLLLMFPHVFVHGLFAGWWFLAPAAQGCYLLRWTSRSGFVIGGGRTTAIRSLVQCGRWRRSAAAAVWAGSICRWHVCMLCRSQILGWKSILNSTEFYRQMIHIGDTPILVS